MILVLNSGSSSLKFALLDPAGAVPDGRRGVVEHIGEPGGVPDHQEAMRQVSEELALADQHLQAVGHRVVHGGSRFSQPVVIDDEVVAAIRALVPLAPLHNPANLTGIEAARAMHPDLPHVAVFDTAFHTTIPPVAAAYAIDAALAQRLAIRRYGFHGTSHRYVSRRAADLLGVPVERLNMIVLHLGNGASATAISGGRSVETSMGLSPLEGLIMGTRPGDVDAAVLTLLYREAGMDMGEIEDLLWHRSGLQGLCGDNDMREILARRADGDAAAVLAFDAYCHRIRKYVGAYHAVLGRLDAVVFTAGVGENAAEVRAACLSGLSHWGIDVEPGRNTAAGHEARLISPDAAAVAVCVVPTDEEFAIAREVVTLIGG
jgi:acetate kinase